MKNIILLLVSGISALTGFSQVPDLPISFDNSSITYTLVPAVAPSTPKLKNTDNFW